MLREIHSIILSDGTRSILVVAILALSIQNDRLDAEASLAVDQSQQQEQLSHPPIMLVDNKYWTKNTEFGERLNWRHLMRPCTLMERIRMSEHTVVSMGSSLDGALESGAIESNIKDLMLANNGLLLLEEDTLDDPMDPLFVRYLNESGDCADGDNLSEHLFELDPDSDDLSWFNPDNWASAWVADEVIDWIPESHRVPCSEDVAIFGSRQWSLGAILDSEERGKVLSFKVNFRPSLYSLQESDGSPNLSINNLRVSKLKIGQQTFSQRELDLLLSSSTYENNLFYFNDSLSLLKQETGYHTSTYQTLLTIDESSVLPGMMVEACLDEAGCLCGNEDANVMRAICSFNEPLEDLDHPCRDPIASSGYCNKICATSISISMDPVRFNEKFVNEAIHKLMTNQESPDYFTENVFIGARRTSTNKYELTFRLVPGDGVDSYDSVLGREQELAELVYSTLNNGATKSFYGIKSMIKKSSIDWRYQNRQTVFTLSFLLLTILATMTIVYEDDQRLKSRDDTDSKSSWLSGLLTRLAQTTLLRSQRTSSHLSDSAVYQGEDMSDIDTSYNSGSTANIPLLSLNS